MANQPLLRNCMATKATEFGEITQNKAITPFKVIQVTDFGTNRKLIYYMRLPILVININTSYLAPFPSYMADYWSNFR